jgi:hypothetical protein
MGPERTFTQRGTRLGAAGDSAVNRTPASKQEERLLGALALMVSQYLTAKNNGLDHMCMGAGERAMTILAEYGLVTDNTRHGRWTDAGERFLDSQ